jgi:PEP-CTERM motif
MKKVTLTLLAFLVLIGFPAIASAGTITGDTVNWQYYAYGGAYPGSGSFVVACTDCGNFDGYFDIDSTANTITFDYSSDVYGPDSWSPSALSLAPDIYNGIDLLFSGASSITSVSIDAATNMAGFNLSDVYFSGDEIQVNWANLDFDTDTIVTLDVNGTGATATPEPGSFLLLGTGLLGLGVLVQRKFAR